MVNRDGELRVDGEPEDTMLACKAIQALLTLSSRGEAIGEQNVRYVIGLVRSGKEAQITELTGDVLCITAKGRPGEAQDHRSEGVYRVGPEKHRHHRRGPGGHRQDVSGRGRRRGRPSGTSRSTASS